MLTKPLQSVAITTKAGWLFDVPASENNRRTPGLVGDKSIASLVLRSLCTWKSMIHGGHDRLNGRALASGGWSSRNFGSSALIVAVADGLQVERPKDSCRSAAEPSALRSSGSSPDRTRGRLAELAKALYLTSGISLGAVPWFETRQNR